MADLKQIETGTDLGVVYINRDHVTHISKNFDPDHLGEGSLIWLVNGKYVPVQGSVPEVKNVLAGG